MINQKWIIRDKFHLLSVITKDPTRVSDSAVLLLPAYTQPMCDVDYFMSRLARKLSNAGFVVMQLDPTGHGDSMGKLEDATLRILIQDIEAAVSQLHTQGFQYVNVVTRGVMANIAIYADSPVLNKVIGLNPVTVDCGEILPYVLGRNTPYMEVAMFAGAENGMKGNTETEQLLNVMGVRLRHAAGQMMHLSILREMAVPSFFTDLYHFKKGAWIFTDKNDGYDWRTSYCGELVRRTIQSSSHVFVRDPLWQQQTMDHILLELTGECNHADSISD